MPMHAHGDPLAAPRQRDDERTPVRSAALTSDVPAFGQPVEDAGKGRALVRETPVKLSYRRRPRGREMSQDVCLALREALLTQCCEI